jgi:hypothetical protein
MSGLQREQEKIAWENSGRQRTRRQSDGDESAGSWNKAS